MTAYILMIFAVSNGTFFFQEYTSKESCLEAQEFVNQQSAGILKINTNKSICTPK